MAGHEYVALVEYAPNQKVLHRHCEWFSLCRSPPQLPKQGKARNDSKAGTIEADNAYKKFVEELLNPPALEVAAPPAEEPESTFKDSPLLAELRNKIQEKRRRAAKKVSVNASLSYAVCTLVTTVHLAD